MTNLFLDVVVPAGSVFQHYSEEEIDNFKCIFEMFDKDRNGFIDKGDLNTILSSLGRDSSEGKAKMS